MYDNQVGTLRITLDACGDCKRYNEGCLMEVGKFLLRGTYMICPEYIPLTSEEDVESYYDKKECDKDECEPDAGCERSGCYRCPKGSSKCIGQTKKIYDSIKER